jgi:hypothetical protein
VDGGASHAFEAEFGKVRDGCAFILEDGMSCGAERRPGSSYCSHHHALCHLSGGSVGERRRLSEGEMLAAAVGGKLTRRSRLPSDHFLSRLEKLLRGLARPNRSRIVLGVDR